MESVFTANLIMVIERESKKKERISRYKTRNKQNIYSIYIYILCIYLCVLDRIQDGQVTVIGWKGIALPRVKNERLKSLLRRTVYEGPVMYCDQEETCKEIIHSE
ncbi:hypothetical protein FKM82_014557 [Ascaphus truei]